MEGFMKKTFPVKTAEDLLSLFTESWDNHVFPALTKEDSHDLAPNLPEQAWGKGKDWGHSVKGTPRF